MNITDRCCLPPSSSLPSLRSLKSATYVQLTTALHKLHIIYCPLRLPTKLSKPRKDINANADSGYASRDEVVEGDPFENQDALTVFRLDEFERSFVMRWLITLISLAGELSFNEEEVSNIIDEASFILSSFSDIGSEDDDDSLIRDFSFPVGLSDAPGGNLTIEVRLKDEPLSGDDHTNVGLQSWGAGIIFAGLLCSSWEDFGFAGLRPGASIIELGAGTGLISLTLAKLLPILQTTHSSLIATDHHPEVLDNLRANITMNYPLATSESMPVKTATLDWLEPPASLQSSVDLLFAADVVYASEHAVWIRDCAAHLLADDGLLWLMVTVRSSGKFEGIPDSAETAFQESNCPRCKDGRVLRILEKQLVDKRAGIGRGDESGYVLYKIGWALT